MGEVGMMKDSEMRHPGMKGSGTLRETAPEYMPHRMRLTYDDYCRLPYGERYELIEGALRKMTPAPNVFHQEVSKRLQRLLMEWIEDRHIAAFIVARWC